MSDYDINEDKYSKFQRVCSDCNNLYISLYQLKTENEKELHSIYEKIKTILIDSKKYSPQNIICDILNIIPYKNRYIKSYLELAKFISDDYQVNEVKNIPNISNFMFYNDYGIKLCKSQDFKKMDKKISKF
ncbi:hypothetical protein TVAG_246800 [Trichomonas vaginalis G3]|uniref:Uncharacterized protein n=1 Tax=Trichomonas vaginalis (strain ATCC PRA-98 / G3) TaxID=412133 RepID=A2DKL9_TRIV3|nr:temperature-gated cation channel protein [Trichomonas vaginalis G3]EAY19002.1 hypothetical protein TVAG_246800 [Trichomonas vaginalis G3]KAI5521205.1 temperature-gated cation channel protein [Trichomonas vaginalis G3]|eukprot:XP_001579988.1 hypothetical protein [Trichomonas vaginalis G3]